MAGEASPLRLLHVGVVELDDSGVIVFADDGARGLVDGGGVGGALVDVLGDTDDVGGPGVVAATLKGSGAPVLVHLTPLPGGRTVATLTAVNEYLAEVQALARVQFRSTIESIIAGFAHEVRNPLAAILSLTEAAMQQQPSHDSVLVRIPGLVGRVESLIRQSLAYSRPEPPRRAQHQASHLIDRALSLLRPRKDAVGVVVSAVDDDVPPLLVDMLHTEQVLVNLLENARDVAVERIDVEVKNGGGPVPCVVIDVVDDGPGVGADVAGRIFDPFFTTKAQGTGLGLSIARDLARLNGGDLQLLSSSKGATFRVSLPVTRVAVRGYF